MFNNHLINDLAWAISSPPLLVLHETDPAWYDSAFYRELFESSSQWFQAQDKNPRTITRQIEAQKDKRLGNYFETLWAIWIEASERFELIERNLQVIEQGRTIGELDFIVFDRELEKTLHWEVAVKFYLGRGDTFRHENWLSPAKKDRLDRKLDHLMNHQTRLCRHEVARRALAERGISIDAAAVILKGCLFYQAGFPELPPKAANADHCRRRWMFLSELENNYDNSVLVSPLIGSGWMAARNLVDTSDYISVAMLLEAIKSGKYHLPLLISLIKSPTETERLFVVQDDWDQLNG